MRRSTGTRLTCLVLGAGLLLGLNAAPVGAAKKKLVPGCDAAGQFNSRGNKWTAIKRPAPSVQTTTAYGIPNGLTVFASDPNVMYVYSKAEVFASKDAGCTWTNALTLGAGIAANMPPDAYYIRDVVVAGRSNSAKVVYVLIAGYRGGLAFESVPSYHVIKSSDGGKTWSLAETGLPSAGYYPRLFIAPNDPDRLYMTSQVYTMAYLTAQLWVSKDGGSTWSQAPDPTFELQRRRFFDVFYEVYIEVDPVDPDDIWRFDGWDGLYRSTDAGSTWSKVEGLDTEPGSPADFQPNGVGDVEIFHEEGSPATIVVSILHQCESNNQSCSVFRSDDGGKSWYTLPLPGASGNYKFGETRDQILMESDQMYRFDKRAAKKGALPWVALGPPGGHDYFGKSQAGYGSYKAMFISDKDFVFRYSGRM